MGSQSGKTFVLDMFEPKTLRVCSVIDHGSEVFGVNWNPAVRDEFLVGCLSGKIHLCNMNKSSKPERVYQGHEKRVFNVIFNN